MVPNTVVSCMKKIHIDTLQSSCGFAKKIFLHKSRRLGHANQGGTTTPGQLLTGIYIAQGGWLSLEDWWQYTNKLRSRQRYGALEQPKILPQECWLSGTGSTIPGPST